MLAYARFRKQNRSSFSDKNGPKLNGPKFVAEVAIYDQDLSYSHLSLMLSKDGKTYDSMCPYPGTHFTDRRNNPRLSCSVDEDDDVLVHRIRQIADMVGDALDSELAFEERKNEISLYGPSSRNLRIPLSPEEAKRLEQHIQKVKQDAAEGKIRYGVIPQENKTHCASAVRDAILTAKGLPCPPPPENPINSFFTNLPSRCIATLRNLENQPASCQTFRDGQSGPQQNFYPRAQQTMPHRTHSLLPRLNQGIQNRSPTQVATTAMASLGIFLARRAFQERSKNIPKQNIPATPSTAPK